MTVVSPLLDFELTLEGRRIFVTGHTGFTGSWLVSWLKRIGCDVAGLAFAPATEPSLFVTANIADGIESTIGDIRDFAVVRNAIERHRPAVIIHLAAKPLVSKSFADPIETSATNALCTAHVLEAARLTQDVKAVVCIRPTRFIATRSGCGVIANRIRSAARTPIAPPKPALNSSQRPIAPRSPNAAMAC